MRTIYSFLLLLIACTGYSRSASSFNDSLFSGTWRGSSLCQVKSSPCHDEIAIYHVSKGAKPGTYKVVMNKMVNGKEEDMGEMIYTYDARDKTLISIDENRKTIWKFSIKDKTMEGTLVYKGELYRIIKLHKD